MFHCHTYTENRSQQTVLAKLGKDKDDDDLSTHIYNYQQDRYLMEHLNSRKYSTEALLHLTVLVGTFLNMANNLEEH